MGLFGSLFFLPFFVLALSFLQSLIMLFAFAALPGDCIGKWENAGSCSASCGSGGTQAQAFHITQEASGNGKTCEAVEGATQTVSCSGPHACRMHSFLNVRLHMFCPCTSYCIFHNPYHFDVVVFVFVCVASLDGSEAIRHSA